MLSELLSIYRKCLYDFAAADSADSWLFRTRQVCWLREHQRQCTSRKEKLKAWRDGGFSCCYEGREQHSCSLLTHNKDYGYAWVSREWKCQSSEPVQEVQRGISGYQPYCKCHGEDARMAPLLIHQPSQVSLVVKSCDPRNKESSLNVCNSNGSNIHDV